MIKKEFKILVAATMSAGKTSVINALIGSELLHSANEATTATITKISNKNGNTFFWATPYSYDEKKLSSRRRAGAELMKQWNADPNIKTINLSGRFKALKNTKFNDVVIYDTPGPNNSMDSSHSELTLEAIRELDYQMLIYVINGTQIGVNDDQYFLKEIKKHLKPQQEVIFLLNKSDCFDSEKGENLFDVVKVVENYLAKIGFNSPIIIPTSASCALSLQKAYYNDELKRIDRHNILNFMDFLSDDYIDACTVSESIKKYFKCLTYPHHLNSTKKIFVGEEQFTTQEIRLALIRSGIGILAGMIQTNLSKN